MMNRQDWGPWGDLGPWIMRQGGKFYMLIPVRQRYSSKLSAVSWVQNCSLINIFNVSVYPHPIKNINFRLLIFNPRYVIPICDLIHFGHDRVRMKQDLP